MSYIGIVKASSNGTVDNSSILIAQVITGMGHTYSIVVDTAGGVNVTTYDAVILNGGRYVAGSFYVNTLNNCRTHLRGGKPLWLEGGEVGYEINRMTGADYGWWSNNVMGITHETAPYSDYVTPPWYMYSGSVSTRTVITGLGDHPILQTPHAFTFPFAGLRTIDGSGSIANAESFQPMPSPPAGLNFLTRTYEAGFSTTLNNYDTLTFDGVVQGGTVSTRFVVTHFTIENQSTPDNGFFQGSTDNRYLAENIITYLVSGGTSSVTTTEFSWLRGNKSYSNILNGYRNYWT